MMSKEDNASVEQPVGLPPMAPVKEAAKCSLQSEGIAALKDVEKNSTVATKRSKLKTGKKVGAKPERRRKRKAQKQPAIGISQASAEMLFHCSCQLLRTQVLDYDVRAREVAERNATQADEIDQWERRVRSLQRELQDFEDESMDKNTRLAMLEDTRSDTSPATQRQESPAEEVVVSATATAIDSSLPPAVLEAEKKLQEELCKRRQKAVEFCRSIPGFIKSVDEQS